MVPAVIDRRLSAETTMKLGWIRERLAMGDRSYCCRLIRKMRERLAQEPTWQETRRTGNINNP